MYYKQCDHIYYFWTHTGIAISAKYWFWNILSDRKNKNFLQCSETQYNKKSRFLEILKIIKCYRWSYVTLIYFLVLNFSIIMPRLLFIYFLFFFNLQQQRREVVIKLYLLYFSLSRLCPDWQTCWGIIWGIVK